MAAQVSIFLGEARDLVFTIKDLPETSCVEITGWTLSFMVKKSVTDPDAAAYILATTSGGGISISGVFNATPSVNTQVATVTISSADTKYLQDGEPKYELKRTDNGSETVLAQGPFVLTRGVHRG